MSDMETELKKFLDEKFALHNHPSFIPDDPVSIPHRFTKKQDREIAGFFAAILAWGTRKGILNSCDKLLQAMDAAPHQFITQANLEDKRTYALFNGFVHRTFNRMDLWHLFHFLQHHYKRENSLETAFSNWMHPADHTVGNALEGFHNYVFSFTPEAAEEQHCRKHIATPAKKSACKRLNMFLRWMVRRDERSVDFGIWKTIHTSQLICPLDVHVARVARRLHMLTRTQNDWQAALELTAFLKQLDPADPVKYDYALFGLGVNEKY